MSKLTVAMEKLAPVADPSYWDGNTWMGEGSLPAIVSEALVDITEVDHMMQEIARATSLPETDEQRVRRATDLAANELREMKPDAWSGWVALLLQELEPHSTAGEYRSMLEALQHAITTRIETGHW